jgi:hypothetical protein
VLQSLARWFRSGPESDRMIFRFTAGGKTRWADPIAVDRHLRTLTKGDDWTRLLQVVADNARPSKLADAVMSAESVAAAEENARSATGKLIELSRTVFTLPLLDSATGEGVSDGEALRILAIEFVRYQVRIGEDYRPL